ncbi:MAG: uroporphyrinogen-III C-methyltransferase [Clostridia bacterium]|jgi:uroporphyrinogen III methyltransferase/synthase|nr:uroporphyrinogen-III C-methyltransferase [Clostridia bacterium]MCI2000485.1 uroporphyrinogen-III C-methyltransferase [Clostridia bacterium]MCI2014940.1 uroporphyrinogen-III C-methyltransferase [Clostridia bacterium]
MSKPFVYIAGAGPGDKELITVKAYELIKKSDVIIYDRLLDSSLLSLCGKNAEKIYVGKKAGRHYMKQDEINSIIADKAMEGKTILRLKGGDPFVFGRGGEEAEYLKKLNIPYEVIPAVSSCISVPEKAGIPVTHRGLSRSFTVVTGHSADGKCEDCENYEALAKLNGTLVFLMGLNNIEKITSSLIKFGKSPDTPAAVISGGTTEKEYIVKDSLKDIANTVENNKKVMSPAIIVVGKTAAFDMRSNIKPPLYGIKVGVSGTTRLCLKISKMLEEKGAYVRTFDYVDIKPIKNTLSEEVKNIKNYSYIVFTSANAIRLFFDMIKSNGFDIRMFSHLKFAVIGEGTKKELAKYYINADFIPQNYTSKDLAKLLIKCTKRTDRLLIPRAEKGTDELTDILSENNIDFKEIKIYDTVLENKNLPATGDLDYFTFASMSSVEGFIKNGLNLSHAKAVAIGEITAKTLEKYGIMPLISKIATAEGIVNTIIDEVCINEQIQETEKQ